MSLLTIGYGVKYLELGFRARLTSGIAMMMGMMTPTMRMSPTGHSVLAVILK